MISDPGNFRDAASLCDWIFDLFAHGFDFLNGRFIPDDDPELADLWDSAEDEITRRDIVAQLVDADGGIPLGLRQYLDIPGGDVEMQSTEFYIRLFSVLSAIDRAAADVNHLHAHTRLGGSRWSRVVEHFERHGKRLQRQASGYVVFRPRYFERAPYLQWSNEARTSGQWTEIPERGEHLEKYFANLLRIFPLNDCELDFRVLNLLQDFHDVSWKKLKVGLVPLIQELKVRSSDAQLLPGPLLMKKDASTPSFSIEIDGDPKSVFADLSDRAEAALRHVAEQGCQIAVFPEMVMPDPVLRRLKEVLADLAGKNRSRPGLTVAGTFTRLLTHHATKPFNVAVVLNHQGEELWRQQKAQPYDMHLHEQRRFGLDSLLQSNPCRENIAYTPRKLVTVDSRTTGLRIMVLICEDLTREPGTRAVRDLHPSLVLTPVMAGPLEATCGFANSIAQLLQDNDGIFLVGNSAALAKAAWKHDGKTGDPPLLLVGVPLLKAPDFRPLETISKTEKVSGPLGPEVLIYQFPS
jgi:hypothetical protein